MMVEPKREILLLPLLRIGVLRAWAARDDFIRLAAVPLSLMVAMLVPLQYAVEQAYLGGEVLTPVIVALMLAYIAVMAVFAVNWLRQLTLGTAAVPGLGLGLAMRHLRFFLLILATSFVSGVLAMVLIALASPFGVAGAGAAIMVSVLVWVVLIARLSPSLIGIAIEARVPLALAWRRTAGHGFKLLIALLAVDVPLMFVRQVLSAVFATTPLIDLAPLTFTLLMVVLQLVGMAVQLAILATAFPHFLRETV